jgi:phosphatidylserine decarboxylase
MVLPFSEYIMENGAKLRLVSIFLSLFNVHVNRSPVSGIVEKIEYRPGKFIIASHKEASYVNEMNRVTVNCAQGKLVFQQVTGILARRVVCHLREGQYVKAGDRIGIMKLGSRMDLILPENIEIKVKPGDQVRAGLTVIGVWQSE